MRHPPALQPGQEPLALDGRADHVVQALEEQERHAEAVGVGGGRALRVACGHLGERPDQALQVLRLEVVGLPRAPAGEVQDGVLDRAAGVDIGRGERGGRGPAAGAAAPDGEPVAVGGALVREGQGDSGAVLDIHHAPLLAQPLAVGAAVSGGTAVVHLGDTDAA